MFFIINYCETQAQTIADFEFEDSLCGNLSVKFTNKSSNANTFFWYFNPGTSTMVSPNYTFSSAGDYDVTLIASGVGGVDTVVKTVHLFSLPMVNPTVLGGPICAGDSGQLYTPNFLRYKYRWNYGGMLNDSTLSNPMAYTLVSRIFEVIVTDTVTGCMDTGNVQYMVKSCNPPKASFSFIPPGCGIFSLKFINNSLNRYNSRWDMGNGTEIIDNSDTIYFDYFKSGTYHVLLTVYDTFGIYSDTISLTVLIGDKVNAQINTVGQKICRGDSIILSGRGGSKPMVWKPDYYLSSKYGDTVYASPRGSIEYWMIAEDHGCLDSTSIKIEVTEYPSIQLSIDSACLGEYANFIAYPNSPLCVWRYGNGDSATGTAVSCLYSDTGLYYGELIYSYEGCDTILFFNTRIFDKPEAYFDYYPTEVFTDRPWVQFYNRSLKADRYRWDFGDGTYIYDTLAIHQFLDSGTYPVQLVAFNDRLCTDTYTVYITVKPELVIIIPDAFTPNNQGPRINETFGIEINQDLPEFEFQIFNNWGQLLFETSNQKFRWDGTFLEKNCSTGMYIWKMRYRISSEKVKNEKGVFFLYR